MIPRSVKDYKELFFGEVMKTNEKDIPHPYLEYMTDDVKDQCYYGTRPQVISNDFREYVWAYYTWQGNPEVGISNELTPDVAWTVYYHKILMTNIILDQLYTMNGTDMERQDLAGEAYFMRAFSYFMQQGHGHLAAISSVAGIRGLAPAPAYSASKAYQTHYLEALRQRARISRKRVCVTDVRPGFVRTPLLSHPEKLFWVDEPEKAVRAIYRAISARKKKAVITRRWAFLAPWMRIAPEWLVAKILGKA